MTTPPVSNANAAPADPSCLELAGRWFLESGIQEPLGGVARYYRSDLSSNARVSTEITGYAASALAYLHSRTGDPRYLEPALRAGRFLTRVAWNSLLRAIPFEVSPGGNPTEGHAYFFDSGIIARGLLALWRVSREAEFLETALDCAESMATDFAAGPEFHPVVVLPSKEAAPRDRRWSRGPGCYQLKAALAWCELAEAAGRAGHSVCYDGLLEYALATHAAFLPGEAERHRVVDRLHAYCYFLEGLLPRATQPDCAAALGEGLRRVADLLAATARLFERSDVYAQLLRLRIFAAALGVVPLERNAAEREVAAILEFQAAGSDPRIAGGFCFGRQGAQVLPYVNPASTAFCAQALEMWRLYRAGGFQPDWRTLI
ncbi:MAG: hypothetical protein ABSE56_08075 [Bryobacteraceae bacterium]